MRIIPVNFFDQIESADLSVTTAVATMPVTNMQSNVRDRVWRSSSAAAHGILGHWGGESRDLNAWGIWPGELYGSTVQLRLYSDQAGTVQIYDSTALTFNQFTGTDFGDYAFGGRPWGNTAAERSARLTPFVRYLSATYTAKCFLVSLVDAGLDHGYFEASRLWLGKYIDSPYAAVAPGFANGWNSNSKHRRSRGGTLRRQVATGRWREMRLEAYLNSEADRYKWMDILAACDPGNEIVVSAHPGDGTTRQERDHTIMGSLEVLNPIALEDHNIHKLRLAVVES
jgi:hypothetical protein